MATWPPCGPGIPNRVICETPVSLIWLITFGPDSAGVYSGTPATLTYAQQRSPPDGCRRGSGPVRLTRAAVTYSKIALSGNSGRVLVAAG